MPFEDSYALPKDQDFFGLLRREVKTGTFVLISGGHTHM